MAALALATSALIFLAVPERARTAAMPSTPRQQLQGLAQVFRDRLFWRLAPMNCAVSATAFSLQGLWAGPWLRDVAGPGARRDAAAQGQRQEGPLLAVKPTERGQRRTPPREVPLSEVERTYRRHGRGVRL